jgi:hypothetical protein
MSPCLAHTFVNRLGHRSWYWRIASVVSSPWKIWGVKVNLGSWYATWVSGSLGLGVGIVSGCVNRREIGRTPLLRYHQECGWSGFQMDLRACSLESPLMARPGVNILSCSRFTAACCTVPSCRSRLSCTAFAVASSSSASTWSIVRLALSLLTISCALRVMSVAAQAGLSSRCLQRCPCAWCLLSVTSTPRPLPIGAGSWKCSFVTPVCCRLFEASVPRLLPIGAGSRECAFVTPVSCRLFEASVPRLLPVGAHSR